MERISRKKVQVIDKSLRDKMSLVDRFGFNFFSDRLSVITNFAPYRELVERDVSFLTQKHHIVMVHRGTRVLNISNADYQLKPGSLLLIPAGCFLMNKLMSDDYEVHSVAFKVQNAESDRLVSHDVISLQLSATNQQIVDNYISMIEQLVRCNRSESDGMGFLLLSLMYLIQEWNCEQNELLLPERQSRAAELCTRFIGMVRADSFPQREPSYYAGLLGVTKGYLSRCVRDNSNRTVMEWINEKTILTAKILLESTERKLDDIANLLYLHSSSQLVKFFKGQTGETPSAYRKRMRGKI